MEVLLNAGFDINAQDLQGQTVAHHAAYFGQHKLIRFLLQPTSSTTGVPDLSVENKRGESPLHLAAKENKPMVIEELLKGRAARSPTNHLGETPLHYAASGGNVEAIKVLCKLGADVEAADERLWRPLHAAAKCGSGDAFRALLSAGAFEDHRDVKGQTPLMIACYWERNEVIQALVGTAADPNLSDDSGIDPLLWTSVTSSADTREEMLNTLKALHVRTTLTIGHRGLRIGGFAKFLVEEAEANPLDIWSPPFNKIVPAAPLWPGIVACQDTIEYLVRKARDKKNPRLLKSLALSGMCGLLREVVDKEEVGSNEVDSVDLDGRQALFYGCASQDLETIEYLAKREGQIKTLRDKSGRVPLDVVNLIDVRKKVAELFKAPGVTLLSDSASGNGPENLDFESKWALSQLICSVMLTSRFDGGDMVCRSLRDLAQARATGFAYCDICHQNLGHQKTLNGFYYR